MKQQAITSYFKLHSNNKVKTEMPEEITNNYIKEEIDLDWDENDNFYESAVDTVTVSEKPAKKKRRLSNNNAKNTRRECPNCKKPSQNKTHIFFCGEQRNLQCNHCSYSSRYKVGLMKHIQRRHSKETDTNSNNQCGYQKYCQKCDVKVSKFSQIKKCEKCFLPLLHQCSKCDKLFDNRKNVNYHWRTRCGVKGYFHCHSCDYKAIDRYYVLKHIKKIHKNSQSTEIIQWKSLTNDVNSQSTPTYQCSKCANLYMDACKFKLHMQNCRVESVEKLSTSIDVSDPTMCSICEKKFKHIYLLNKHITVCRRDQHIARRIKGSSDEIIEVVGGQPTTTLISADEIFQGIKEKAIDYCKQCMTESEVEEKWWDNSDEQRPKCQKCKSTLVIKCKKCPKAYLLKYHILRHVQWVCYPEDEYKCTKCDFKATNLQAVRSHYKMHHSNTNSECKKCGKVYKNFPSCKKHEKRCRVLAKLQCDHCSYKSKVKADLRSHIFQRHIRPQELKVIDKIALAKISKERFSRTFVHLEADCSKCKTKQYLLNRRKICNKCKTKLHFKCKACKKKYTADDEDACNHVKGYLDMIKLECGRCGRGYATIRSLGTHKSGCKSEFPCRFCKHVATSRDSRRKHETYVHSVKYSRT